MKTNIDTALALADGARADVTGYRQNLQAQDRPDMNVIRDGLVHSLRELRHQLRVGRNGKGELARRADALLESVLHLDAAKPTFMLDAFLEEVAEELDFLAARLRG